MSRAFYDTNIVVYAFSRDAKAERARALLAGGGWISVQVLNEFASVARRKLGMSWAELHEALVTVCGLCPDVATVGLDVHRRGLALAERYRLAIYDAMIVAAALEAGCGTLWSEDMQDGLRVEDALTVQNPFATPN